MLSVLVSASLFASGSQMSTDTSQRWTYLSDGNQLHEMCKRPVPHACLGYVIGAADGLTLMGAAQGKHFVCIPPTVKWGQVKDVVVRYVDDNPQLRHHGAAMLVSNALAAAFPCGR